MFLRSFPDDRSGERAFSLHVKPQRYSVSPGALFRQIGTKRRIPDTDIFRGIKQCVVKISGTAVFHFCIRRSQLSVLAGRRGKTGVRQKLTR